MKWRIADIRAFFKVRTLKKALVLDQHNIYILPTRWGLSFVGLILLFMLISTNYNNNLGFMLSFLLTSIGLTSALYAQRNLAGLTLNPGKPSNIFLGTVLPYEIHIYNPGKKNRYSIDFYEKSSARTHIDRLESHNTTQITLSLQPDQRGWYNPEVIVLESRFPLGLFRTWSRFRFDWQALVYPTPAMTYQPYPLSGGLNHIGAHDDDDDFAGFKNYSMGDPLKSVHWKNFAKGRGLLTRIYRQQDQDQIWLDWSLTTEMHKEAKLSRLCRWVIDAEKDAINYGLRLPNLEIAPDHGKRHFNACLQALALFDT